MTNALQKLIITDFRVSIHTTQKCNIMRDKVELLPMSLDLCYVNFVFAKKFFR